MVEVVADVVGNTTRGHAPRVARVFRDRRDGPVGKVDIAVVVDDTRRISMPSVVGKLRARRDISPVGIRDIEVVEVDVTIRVHIPHNAVVVRARRS